MESRAVRVPVSSGPHFKQALISQIHVIYALALHDIKSRFFGNGIGYILTILWPASHIVIIMGIFYFSGRRAPYGDSALLYAGTGVLPYIIWNYISRFTMLGMIMNRNFLSYPVIKPIDMIVARQLLEIVSCTIITYGMIIFLMLAGVPVVPNHPVDAVLAILSAAYLGIGFGVLGSVITMLFPFFNIIYVGILIVSWITAGVAINPEALPERVGYYISFSPLLHSIEWLRSAYYQDFPAHLLDKQYLLETASITLFAGLLAERFLRFAVLRA